MVQINFAQKQVNAKIVFYGPGMSGKTTNLEVVHQRAPEDNRGDLTSISTDGDRTLFFDYMPLALGTVAGMRTCFQLYTVPGQVYYNSTRKLVLQGVDGVIFVADSSASMMEQNLESLRNLEENLNEYGKSLSSLPYVLQYNKRDLPDALPVDDLDTRLNRHAVPTFEAIASTGQGVFPTLKRLAALVLQNIMAESSDAVAGVPGRPQEIPAAPGAGAAPPPAFEPQPGAMAAPPAVAPEAPQAPAYAQPAAAQYAQPQAAPPQQPVAQQPVARPQAAPAAVAAPAQPKAHPMEPGQGAVAPAPRTAPGTRRVATTRAAPPKKKRKSSAVYTAAFVVLAAAVGALLTSVALSVF